MDYLLTQRPPSIGTHPVEGLIGQPKKTTLDNGRNAWVLSYDRGLDDEEVRRYELSPVYTPMNAAGTYVYSFGGRDIEVDIQVPRFNTVLLRYKTTGAGSEEELSFYGFFEWLVETDFKSITLKSSNDE